MKKVLMIVLCLTFTLGFAACGDSGDPGESASDEINYFDGTLVGYYEYSSGGNICIELQFDSDDETVIMKPMDPNFSESEGTFTTDGKTMNFNGLESDIEYIEPTDDAIKEWIKGYNLSAAEAAFPEIDKAEVSGGEILKFMIYDELPNGAQATFYGIPKDSLTITEKTNDYSDSPVVGAWKCTKAKVGDTEYDPKDLQADNYYVTFNADGTAEITLYEGHEGAGTWKPGRTNEIELESISGKWSYDKQKDCILNVEDSDDGKITYYFTRYE